MSPGLQWEELGLRKGGEPDEGAGGDDGGGAQGRCARPGTGGEGVTRLNCDPLSRGRLSSAAGPCSDRVGPAPRPPRPEEGAPRTGGAGKQRRHWSDETAAIAGARRRAP